MFGSGGGVGFGCNSSRHAALSMVGGWRAKMCVRCLIKQTAARDLGIRLWFRFAERQSGMQTSNAACGQQSVWWQLRVPGVAKLHDMAACSQGTAGPG